MSKGNLRVGPEDINDLPNTAKPKKKRSKADALAFNTEWNKKGKKPYKNKGRNAALEGAGVNSKPKPTPSPKKPKEY